jgi:hypothetical protein
MTVLINHAKRREVVERGAEAGAPDHGIDDRLAPIRPDDIVGCESHKWSDTMEHAPIARLSYRWHHHNIAQAADWLQCSPFLQCPVARGRLLKQHAAVHIIRQEMRWLQCDPRRIRDFRDLGQNLCT